MLIRVRHVTEYAYDRPVEAIQLLRLEPAERSDQRVREWRISLDGQMSLSAPFVDGFGNRLRLARTRSPLTRIQIRVEGIIDSDETHGVTRLQHERAPVGLFLRRTPLTEPTLAVARFAEAAAERATGPLELAHALMSAVHIKIAYTPGVTDVETSADDVLKAGRGVCQDHTHLLIAAARHVGIPARYVSGYLLDPLVGLAQAPHAWAELHVKDLGWIGFDPANGISSTERHVAVAMGLDFHSAAPVVGIVPREARERLKVEVALAAGQGAQ